MESIKLLIEAPEVSLRVQVAMLLEEEILKHAIYEKYGNLLDQREQQYFRRHMTLTDSCAKTAKSCLRRVFDFLVLGNLS